MKPPIPMRATLWILGLFLPISWEVALVCSACGKTVAPDNVEAHDAYFYGFKH